MDFELNEMDGSFNIYSVLIGVASVKTGGQYQSFHSSSQNSFSSKSLDLAGIIPYSNQVFDIIQK